MKEKQDDLLLPWLTEEESAEYQAYVAEMEIRCARHVLAMKREDEKKWLPKHFVKASFESIEEDGIPDRVRAAFDRCKRYAGGKAGLYIYGRPGSMKTTLAAAIYNKLYTPGALFISCDEFFARTSNLFARRLTREMAELQAEIATAPLIVLDDLGQEELKPWVQRELEDIVSRCYRDEVPVIVTSNLSYNDCWQEYSERFCDRLFAVCEYIEIPEGESLRRLPGC